MRASTRSFSARCAAMVTVLVVAACTRGGGSASTEPAAEKLGDVPELQMSATAPVTVFVVTEPGGAQYEVSVASDAALLLSSAKVDAGRFALRASLSATAVTVGVVPHDGATSLLGDLESFRFDASAYSGEVTTGFARTTPDGLVGCRRDDTVLRCDVRLGTEVGGPPAVFTDGSVTVVGDPLAKAEIDELLAAVTDVVPALVVALAAPTAPAPTCLVALEADGSLTPLPPAPDAEPCTVESGPAPTTSTSSTSTTLKPTTTTAKPTTTTAKPTTTTARPTTTVRATTTTRPRATTTTVRRTTTTVRATTTTIRSSTTSTVGGTTTSTPRTTSTTPRSTSTTERPTTTAGAPSTSAPPISDGSSLPPEDDGGGGAVVAWLVGALVLLGGTATTLLVRRRARNRA